MQIEYFQNQEALDQRGSGMIIQQLNEHLDLKLCAATGNSPTGIYRKLVEHKQTAPQLYVQLHLIKLDEWVGLDKEALGSCEKYLQAHLIKPLEIASDRFLSFNPEAIDPSAECQRVQTELSKISPIDICVLGLGKNGHIGFNEPGKFEPHCHVRQLQKESMEHDMISSDTIKPTQGMTLGTDDILSSRKVILIVSGSGKEHATKDLLSGMISAECPASILWKHPDVTCLVYLE